MGWSSAYESYNSDWDRVPVINTPSINEVIIQKNYDRLSQMLTATAINAKNISGDTVLHTHLKHCIRHSDSSHPLCLTDMRLLILLLKSGANPDILDQSGISGRKYLMNFGYTIHGHALRIRQPVIRPDVL